MRLNADLVRRAPQFNNTLLQREIDLRGLCLTSLDEGTLNLLENDFDVINLTSNALTSLQYFPTAAMSGRVMDRVVTLIAHRNNIHHVSLSSCVLALPNVEHFLADTNQLKTIQDLYFLKFWPQLSVLSIQNNPVMRQKPDGWDDAHLQAYLVYLCPKLKLINYARVTQNIRQLAATKKKEFSAMTAEWEQANTVPSVGGKRTRKRGREQRAMQADLPAGKRTATQPSSSPQASTEQPVASSGISMSERLRQLDERLASADLTEEEMLALEEEMNEITAKMGLNH